MSAAARAAREALRTVYVLYMVDASGVVVGWFFHLSKDGVQAESDEILAMGFFPELHCYVREECED